MTDEAIANGIYMRKLSRLETAAVLAEITASSFYQRKEFGKVIAVADVILRHYPKDVSAMLLKSAAYAQIAKRDFLSKYARPEDLPINKRAHFRHLGKQNQLWFAKAEALGWRQPTAGEVSAYLQSVNREKLRH